MRDARTKVPGLPEGFRYQDLRHYVASLLIASGADVKTVHARPPARGTPRRRRRSTPAVICDR
jgi:hypothetical protein